MIGVVDHGGFGFLERGVGVKAGMLDMSSI
jgi:hypothetical protein